MIESAIIFHATIQMIQKDEHDNAKGDDTETPPIWLIFFDNFRFQLNFWQESFERLW